MTPAYKPGDLVTRTGETAMGLVKGETYRIVALDWSRPPGLLYFAEAPEVAFRAAGFRPAETGEGKP